MPTDSRIRYKLSSLCYNCFNSTAIDCLTKLLTGLTHRLASNAHLLTITVCLPSVGTHSLVIGSFPYATVPSVWILYKNRASDTLSSFRSSSSWSAGWCVCVCLCVCVCVCVCVCACVCVCMCVCMAQKSLQVAKEDRCLYGPFHSSLYSSLLSDLSEKPERFVDTPSVTGT